MAEEVKLPQLGESVTEGTITAWLVEEGEEVSEDQPLFEISTDKIDTEVPSPASGVLKEIRAQVDDTIEVGEVVAIIDTDGEAGGGAEEEAPADEAEGGEGAEEAPAEEPEEGAEEPAEDEEAPAEEPAAEEEEAPAAEEPAEDAPGRQQPSEQVEETPAGDGNGQSKVTSPIVRKLLRENDLDASQIQGSGEGGRITREDVEKAIAEGGAKKEAAPAAKAEGKAAPQRPSEGKQTQAAPAARKPPKPEGRSRTENLSRVRQAIARGMWQSLQTTAQLTAVVEVDVTAIMRTRDQAKRAFQEREGVSLSPFPFFARAVCMVLPRHESLNAAIDVEDGTATYYDYINLGIAVDAPQGLIVPNIKGADDLTIPALARAIADIADRTRNKGLKPDEVSGATFTLTNTGSRGVMIDTPILNPPEVGILATTKIEKRPVVVTDEDGNDSIAIRWMTYLCLTYDHRMVDGADAARFLGDLKEVLETHDFGPEVGA